MNLLANRRWKSWTIREAKFYGQGRAKADEKTLSNFKLKKTLNNMKKKFKVQTSGHTSKYKKLKIKKFNDKPKKVEGKKLQPVSSVKPKPIPEFPSQRKMTAANQLFGLIKKGRGKKELPGSSIHSLRSINTPQRFLISGEKPKKPRKARNNGKLKQMLAHIKEASSQDKSPARKKKKYLSFNPFKQRSLVGGNLTKISKKIKTSKLGYIQNRTPNKKAKKKKPKKKKKKIKSGVKQAVHPSWSTRMIRPDKAGRVAAQNSTILERIASVSSVEKVYDDELERDILRNKKYREFQESLRKKVGAGEEFGRVVETIHDTFQDTSANSWILIFQTSLDFYFIEGEIGKGSFAKVYKARQILTNTPVALKKICKKTIRVKGVEEKIQREIKILKNLNDHPNVVRLIEEFEDDDFYYLAFEFLQKGDLVSFFKTNDLFKGEQLKKFFYQILEGLRHVHLKGVIHRDIKPENILFDSELSPKIADFGISTIFRKKYPILDTGGTPIYLAPEVIENKGRICFNTDIWSCGILFYLLAVGDVPFKAEDVQILYGKILSDPFAIPPSVRTPDMDSGLDDLLEKMLTKDPAKRLSLVKCMRHPWFRPFNKNLHKKKQFRQSGNRSKSQNYSASNSQSLTKSKLLLFASDLKERLLNPQNFRRNQSQVKPSQARSCKNIPFLNNLSQAHPGAVRGDSVVRERETIQKKTMTQKKKIDNFDTFFNSSTEFINTNSKNYKSQRKIKKLTLGKKEVEELKVSAVVDFLAECQFPKKYVLETVFAKDKQFTHIKSCFDQLLESL